MANRRLLLLDDDEDVLEALGDLAEALGVKSVLARSFAELEARADDALSTELAILDLNLGSDEPSGLDAFDWLKQRGYPGTVTFLSGHGAAHPLVERVCKIEGARLLRKPIGLDELRALLAG